MIDSNPQIWENVPSPFCGISSDDLTIQAAGNAIKLLVNGDAVTVAGFEQPVTDTQPRVDGKEVSLDEAIGAAASLLKKSRLPLFSGFGTDVNDTRSALSLADRVGAVLDQARAEGGPQGTKGQGGAKAKGRRKSGGARRQPGR